MAERVSIGVAAVSGADPADVDDLLEGVEHELGLPGRREGDRLVFDLDARDGEAAELQVARALEKVRPGWRSVVEMQRPG